MNKLNRLSILVIAGLSWVTMSSYAQGTTQGVDVQVAIDGIESVPEVTSTINTLTFSFYVACTFTSPVFSKTKQVAVMPGEPNRKRVDEPFDRGTCTVTEKSRAPAPIGYVFANPTYESRDVGGYSPSNVIHTFAGTDGVVIVHYKVTKAGT